MIAIDMNILVHAFDKTAGLKYARCRQVIQDAFSGRSRAALTNQILAEFAWVCLSKVKRPAAPEKIAAIISSILSSSNWEVFSYGPSHVLGALKGKGPFWDALIARTLLANDVHAISTENVKNFAESGMSAKDPF